jgi:hypothetical protein
VNFTARILLDDAKLTRQTSTDCAQRSQHSGDAGHLDIPPKRKSVDKNCSTTNCKALVADVLCSEIARTNLPRSIGLNGNNQIASDLVITQRFRWDYLMLLKKKGPRERPLTFLHTIIDHAYWR